MTIPQIQLDTPGGGGIPAVKFGNVGDSIVVGIVDIDEVASFEMNGDRKKWDDGTERTHKRVTGLVVQASDGVYVGPQDDREPVKPGDLVSFHCEGGRWFTYKDALDAAGGVNVGHVMKWWFESTKPATRAGFNDQKIYKAQIRQPEDRDGDLATRCYQAHQELRTGAATLDAPTTPAPSYDEAF